MDGGGICAIAATWRKTDPVVMLFDGAKCDPSGADPSADLHPA